MTAALAMVAVVGSGLVAGVLFAVALSVLPALFALTPDRYVVTHRLLGRNWDPTMPVIVLATTAASGVAAYLSTDPVARWLFAAGALLLLGVSGVSHLANVPINRRVKAADPGDLASDWQDPRPLWRRWHLLRTALAAAGLLVNAAAVVLR